MSSTDEMLAHMSSEDDAERIANLEEERECLRTALCDLMVFVDTPSNRSYLGEYNYQEFYAALSQAREALKDTDDPADNVSAYEIRSII
jgi:uncharacterized protein YllA (UPF0747 family)